MENVQYSRRELSCPTFQCGIVHVVSPSVHMQNIIASISGTAELLIGPPQRHAGKLVYLEVQVFLMAPFCLEIFFLADMYNVLMYRISFR